MASGFGSSLRSFWHAMTSYDRHASHDSPYRTGSHVPLNQNKHATLTSVATSGAVIDSPELNSTFQGGTPNGLVGSPQTATFPTSPYTPGMRSSMAARRQSTIDQDFDPISPGEIQLQSFHEGLPPPPPVTHSWKRIDRWAEDSYPELYDQLSEGCTTNDLNELEHELDCSLPIEVRESLQCHDGQERGGRPTGIVFGCMLLDCEEIVQEWRNWKTVSEEYLQPNTQRRPSQAQASTSAAQGQNVYWRQDLLDKQDSQPPRAVQKAYAHPGWVPLARDWGGNNLAVDLAPGPAGKWGQVIIFGRDFDCKVVVARSWSAFLAVVADDICSDRVEVEEESGDLKLREFKDERIQPPYLDILRWRMDQKYGRRFPKRKAPNGAAMGPRHGSPRGSPYGSPTDDRGRSPARIPSRGPISPRLSAPQPSPLSKMVSENNIIGPVPVRKDPRAPTNLQNKVEGKAKPEKLVEAPTPTVTVVTQKTSSVNPLEDKPEEAPKVVPVSAAEVPKLIDAPKPKSSHKTADSRASIEKPKAEEASVPKGAAPEEAAKPEEAPKPSAQEELAGIQTSEETKPVEA